MRECRQDSHVFPLAAWAALCALTAVVLFVHSGRVASRALRIEEVAAGAGLLVVRPAALAVYIWRARRLWVGMDPERGLVVNGKYLLPWEEIRWIERRRPRLRGESGPARMREVSWPELDSGNPSGWGCWLLAEAGGVAAGIVVLALAAFALCWLVFALVIPVLMIPAVEVLLPLGDRIRVVAWTRDLVLRDLRGAEDFIAEVRSRVRVVET